MPAPKTMTDQLTKLRRQLRRTKPGTKRHGKLSNQIQIIEAEVHFIREEEFRADQ